MLNALDKSKQRATMADMRQIALGAQLYSVDHSIFPANGTSSSALVVIIEPFTEALLHSQDHWAHDYQYNTDGLTWYSIESYGRDGIDGLNVTPSSALLFELDLLYASGHFVNAPI